MREYLRNTIHTHLRPDPQLVALEDWIRETYDIPDDALSGVYYQDLTTHPHTVMYELQLEEGIDVERLRDIAEGREDLTCEVQTNSQDTKHITVLDVEWVNDDQRIATSKANFNNGTTRVGFSLISESEPFEVGDATHNTLETLRLYFNEGE